MFNAEARKALQEAIASIDTEKQKLTAGHLLSAVLKQRDTSLYAALNKLVPNLEGEIVDLDNKIILTKKTTNDIEIQTTITFTEAITLATTYAKHKNQLEVTLSDLFCGLISSEYLTPAVMFADFFHLTPRKVERYLF